MQVLLDEARDSYKPNIVLELVSETIGEMESNAERITKWVKEWEQSIQ